MLEFVYSEGVPEQSDEATIAIATSCRESALMPFPVGLRSPRRSERLPTAFWCPSRRVCNDDKMRLSKDKTRLTVNKSLAQDGIPPEVYEYRLGNRTALDLNRLDDPQYIVRLVGQGIRVSLETVKLVKALPETFSLTESG